MILPRSVLVLTALAFTAVGYLAIPSSLTRTLDAFLRDMAGNLEPAVAGGSLAADRTVIVSADPGLDVQALLMALGELKPAVVCLDAQSVGLGFQTPLDGSLGKIVVKGIVAGPRGRLVLGPMIRVGDRIAPRATVSYEEDQLGIVRWCRLTKGSLALTLLENHMDPPSVEISRSRLVLQQRGATWSHPLADGLLPLDLQRGALVLTLSAEKILKQEVPEREVHGRVVFVAPTDPTLTPMYRALDGSSVAECRLDAASLETLLRSPRGNSSLSRLFEVLSICVLFVTLIMGNLRRVDRRVVTFGIALVGALIPLGAFLLDSRLGGGMSLTAMLIPWVLGWIPLVCTTVLEFIILDPRFSVLQRAGGWTSRRLFDTGVTRIRNGNYLSAIDLLSQAIMLDTNLRNRGLSHIVECHLKTSELDLARSMYSEIDLEALEVDTLTQLFRAFRTAGLSAEALKIGDILQKKDPSRTGLRRDLESLRETGSEETDLLKDLIRSCLSKEFLGLSPLRRGGMALVYGAFSKALNRPVALKILTPNMGSDEFMLRRFFIEAETLKDFHHPAIVEVYSIVRNSPLKYYVMENIFPALSMREVIDTQGKMPVARGIQVIKQVLDALEYCHQRSVVHRDIKPANIMLRAGDEVKLIDFGIAKVDRPGQATQAGIIMGTDRYMSPEQFRGRAVDARTDIYAIGVVLFELLTGEAGIENPFAAKLKGHASITHTILTKGLPNPIVAIILKALEFKPENRLQSAREFKVALEECEHLSEEEML